MWMTGRQKTDVTCRLENIGRICSISWSETGLGVAPAIKRKEKKLRVEKSRQIKVRFGRLSRKWFHREGNCWLPKASCHYCCSRISGGFEWFAHWRPHSCKRLDWPWMFRIQKYPRLAAFTKASFICFLNHFMWRWKLLIFFLYCFNSRSLKFVLCPHYPVYCKNKVIN